MKHQINKHLQSQLKPIKQNNQNTSNSQNTQMDNSSTNTHNQGPIQSVYSNMVNKKRKHYRNYKNNLRYASVGRGRPFFYEPPSYESSYHNRIAQKYNLQETEKIINGMKSISPRNESQPIVQAQQNSSLTTLNDLQKKSVEKDIITSQILLNTSFNGKKDFCDHDSGPGSYNQPEIIGNKRVNSFHPNVPAYSFSTQKKLFNMHSSNFGPGVGSYSPEKLKLQRNSPNCKISKEKKFFSHEASLESFKPALPVYYGVMDKGSKIKGGALSKQKRFVNKIEVTPGPADYSSSYDNKLRQTVTNLPTTFGTAKLSSNLMGEDKPGPANYHYPSSFAKNRYSKISIPKANRFKEEYESPKSPGPSTYNLIRKEKYQSHRNPEFSFGNSRKGDSIKKLSILSDIFQRSFSNERKGNYSSIDFTKDKK